MVGILVKVREDMTGWVMSEHGVPDSRLTVKKQTDDYINPKGVHYARWECECSCGSDKTVVATSGHLKDGIVRSCGCLAREVAKERIRRNKIEAVDDYYIAYINNSDIVFSFDKCDLEIVQQHTWWADVKKDGNIYIRTTIYQCGKKKNMYLHRLLTGNDMTDHVDKNPLNNRRYNLRVANNTQNNQNTSLARNNTSGVTGVSWTKSNNKWHANIMVNYKNINLGYFDNIIDAIKARLDGEAKYFGDFAPQRHLFEEYGII
jgi:hypothetical protein